MRTGNCRHFTGLMNDACDVGVAYATVRDESVRPFRLPCLTVSWRNKTEPCATTCPKFSAFTANEEKAQMTEFAKATDRMLLARTAIVAVVGKWTKGSGNASGTMTCPCCKAGTLRYSRAGYNGHIHAACSTSECVRWME
jgi:hypothetical protein